MNENEKKEVKFTNDQKLAIGGMVTSAGIIGFVLGDRHRLKKIGNMIGCMTKADPTFLQHWYDALDKVLRNGK